MIYFAQIAPAPAPANVPTIYLDFPPGFILTIGYVLFAGLFHWACFVITKIIYG